MANTTSGTATFDKTFAIDEIVEEAFERIGLQNVAGYQLKSARRSLNILFQEWGNRGLHYWEVAETNIDLIEGQAEYNFFRSTGDGTSSGTNATSDVYGVADILEEVEENEESLEQVMPGLINAQTRIDDLSSRMENVEGLDIANALSALALAQADIIELKSKVSTLELTSFLILE